MKKVEEKKATKAVEEKKAKKAVEEKDAKKAAPADKKAVKADDKKAAKAVPAKEEKKAAPADKKAVKADDKKAAKAVPAKEEKKAAPADKKAVKADDKKAEKAVEEKKAKKAVKEEVAEEVIEEEEVSVTRPGIVEIYEGKDGFYFTFRSFHGFLIGRSQGYTTKDSCKNGIKAVMNACAEADIFDNCGKDPVKDYAPKFGKAMFELYKDKAGKFRFRLFSKNSQRVAASEDYVSKANLKSAIGSLKKIAENYTLKDSSLKRQPKA